MRLNDYNTVAYRLAMRNPRVIELLVSKLTDDAVAELLTFGIDATSVYIDEHGKELRIRSTQELYLGYDHLRHIKHTPNDPYVLRQGIDEDHNDFEGFESLVHPLSKKMFVNEESIEDAIPRIDALIETRGRGNKLQRLMDGMAFDHYDAVTFFGETVYSLDPSTNTAKTIRSDIKFITEWIQPEKYLQLLPDYTFLEELDDIFID